MKNVSVIIISYNTCELTRNCLKSVFEKTKDIDFDVWVVDNASKDNSCKMIKNEFPQVNLIENETNLGFGAANNIPIEKCDAKYVFCLNSDTVLINNAVKILFDFMENNPKAGACGGNLYANEEMKPNLSFGIMDKAGNDLKLLIPYFKKKAALKRRAEGEIDLNNTDNELKQVGFIIGADLMLRKEVLDRAGVFDEDFFFYYEEVELQARIKDLGSEVWIVPDAKIVHYSEGSGITKHKRLENRLKSEYIYFKKRCEIKRFSLMEIVFYSRLIGRFLSTPETIFNVWKFMWKHGDRKCSRILSK